MALAAAGAAQHRTVQAAHIRAEGWHDWDRPQRQATADYAEYRNRGAGAGRSGRVHWSRTLTAEQAATYTREQILGDWRPFR